MYLRQVTTVGELLALMEVELGVKWELSPLGDKLNLSKR